MRTAYISGASRGIGAGIAKVLAANGYALALTCEKNADALEMLRDELAERYGTEVLCYTADASDMSEIADICEEITERLGAPDAVINNAGISYVGLITDMTPDEWDHIIGVNLSSVFYTTKAFLPDMIRRGSGHIINISSMWGRSGASCEVAYSATKGGMDAFTKALAKEVAPSGIAVNALSCGVIDTDMNRALSDEERAALVDEIPMCRFGTPEDVGRAVMALLGTTYVTGQIIGVDGGI